ncbi:putative GNAT family acetyltransferase [Xylariaceae sp. FL0016]|nr:putative GNAT family acetyltransferase [Xylariaceae sp. FL0016]
MSLQLLIAKPADAARIADIHMAAFGSNALLLAQFPTPAVREGLREAIRVKALADIDDPKTTVLIVKDAVASPVDEGNDARPRAEEARPIIAFAKWSHPVTVYEGYEEPPWIWPDGTDLKLIDAWAAVTDKAQKRAWMSGPCYKLTFMGTDPAYRGRGAASVMIHWGIDRCDQERALAYLESTVEAASLYKKLGFSVVENFSLEYHSLQSGQRERYGEISMVYNGSTGTRSK